jgi:hypothetical protein|tara:strand:+ start:311 stop:586 length:276 start_codon:yes stop_codon:yes gene_type:complete
MKDLDSKLIYEAYVNEDLNDQYAPEDAPADDQMDSFEPLEGEDEESDNNSASIARSLESIVGELKTLNQYVDFITTGTRAPGFTGGVDKKR